MKRYIIVFSLVVFAGCYYDKEDELYPTPAVTNTGCDTSNVTYTNTVKGILDQKCSMSGCHDAATRSFGHNLSDYNGTKTSAQGGRLLGSIMHNNGFIQMPKGMNKLDDCDISKISAWINAGTPQ